MVLPQIFGRFGIDINSQNAQENIQKTLVNINKTFFKKGGFKVFAKKYPKSAQKPYWLALHGIKLLLKLQQNNALFTDEELFKPQNQWKKIKQDVFKTMEERARAIQ